MKYWGLEMKNKSRNEVGGWKVGFLVRSSGETGKAILKRHKNEKFSSSFSALLAEFMVECTGSFVGR